jgi:hypothetical protein
VSYGGDRSGNNLAVYEDHKWCFACKLYIGSGPRISQPVLPEVKGVKPMPEDSTTQLGSKAWNWLAKYGIMPEEAKEFWWSDEKQWLIFPFYNGSNACDPIAWQARNFNVDRPKPKYYTQGPRNSVFAYQGKGKICVLTEDLLSAIKVGRSPGIVGLPILGADIGLARLVRLRTEFDYLGIWLDMDKATDAVKARSRASQLDFKDVFTVMTPKDPKEYINSEVTNILCQAMEK